MNNNLAIAIGIGSALAVFSAGVTIHLLDVKKQLDETKIELRKVEDSNTTLQKDMTEKEKEITQLNQNVSKLDDDNTRLKRMIEGRSEIITIQKEQIKTVSFCLVGMIQALQQARVGNNDAFITLGRIEEKCKEAERIIQKLDTEEQEESFGNRNI